MNEHAYGYHQGVDEVTMRLRAALDLQDTNLELDELLGVVTAYVSYFEAHQRVIEMITKVRR